MSDHPSSEREPICKARDQRDPPMSIPLSEMGQTTRPEPPIKPN